MIINQIRTQNALIRPLSIPDRWCVHSYYTLCPYAPDGSGRLLLAGADLDQAQGEVIIISAEGQVLDRFGQNSTDSAFFHTGFWQTWSPDARYVYYQSGTLTRPRIVRRELANGHEIVLDGDMEGAPPDGEPIISGLMGMLYAAGYGEGLYRPDLAPVPFQKRAEHGLFAYTFDPLGQTLRLSVAEMLEMHPHRDQLHQADHEIRAKLGPAEGLTLMLYCVRWSPTGERFLFYFGNHTVKSKVKDRGEPKLGYVFTADRDFKEIHLAVDLSFGRPGVHWGWHPDGVHLIGYGPDPDQPGKSCLAQVRYDGANYRRLSLHNSGGHPSISPGDHNLIVTDDTRGQPGQVLFIDARTGDLIKSIHLDRVYGLKEPPGRNPYRVCHHPVFNQNGDKVLVNTLPGRHAVLCELGVN